MTAPTRELEHKGGAHGYEYAIYRENDQFVGAILIPYGDTWFEADLRELDFLEPTPTFVGFRGDSEYYSIEIKYEGFNFWKSVIDTWWYIQQLNAHERLTERRKEY